MATFLAVVFSWMLVIATVVFNVKDAESKSLDSVCKNSPADVVFLLDESGSMWGPHFQNQLNFVTGLADVFNIDNNAVRIGVMTFGDTSRVQFHLGDIPNYNALNSVITQVEQLRGDSKTGSALQRMRREMFCDEFARPEAAHIAVVITDGDSDNPNCTAEEALKAHTDGITVFAVGVGNTFNYDVLYAIASKPEYVFSVVSYDDLDTMKKILALKACEVASLASVTPKLTPTTTPTPPPTPKPHPTRPQNIRKCRAADVIFALPDEAGLQDTNLTLNFIQNVLPDAEEIGPYGIQIGVTPRICSSSKPAINLNAKTNTRDFLRALDRRYLETTLISVQLQQIMIGMEEADDGRGDVPQTGKRGKLAVVIVDNISDDPDLVELLAEEMKSMDIELVTIGVGEYVDTLELALMASNKDSWHHVNSYDELTELEFEIAGNICRSPNMYAI